MAQQRLKIRNFSGGTSDDESFGAAHSASSVIRSNIRKSPALLSAMQAPVNEYMQSVSGGANSDITDAVRVSTGDVYFCAGTHVLKRAAGANGAVGTYTVLELTTVALIAAGYTATVGDPNASHFAYYADYRPDLNKIFFYGFNTITEFDLNNGNWVLSKYYNLQEVNGAANTGGNYPVPNAIVEAERFSFTLKAEPLYAISPQISSVGTNPSWTATVHDEANNVVATLTQSVVVGINDFLFTTTRMKVGTTYHVHFTTPGTGGTITATAANDLPHGHIDIYSNRLVPSVTHPVHQYGPKSYVANDRYITEWEILDTSANATSGYLPARIILPSNYKTICFADYSEYMAIGCEINESTDTNDNIGRNGAIVFWNTTSQLIDWVMPVPDGAPNGLTSYRGGLHWEANGVKYSWFGGDIETDYEFPGTSDYVGGDSHFSIEGYARVNPSGMAVHDNLLHVGWPALTTNANARIGVYSFGRRKSQMPSAVNYDYTMSTGAMTPKFRTTSPYTPRTGITMVKSFGNNLFIAWKDGRGVSNAADWGIDIVNNSVSQAATSGSWESLWFDNDDPDIEKTTTSVKVTFRALPAGCTVQPKIRYDRSDTWVLGEIIAVEGDVDIVLTVGSGENHPGWYEAMFGFDWTSESGNNVDIRSVTLKFNDNREQTKNNEVRRAT